MVQGVVVGVHQVTHGHSMVVVPPRLMMLLAVGKERVVDLW